MRIEAILAEVASELDWLEPPPVFVGGATIGLFLDDFGRAQMRPTKDVDCIVPGVLTQQAWFALEGVLRQRGWRPDPHGPICRYRSPRGHVVDLLGARPDVQGFAGRWFERAAERAEVRVLDAVHTIRTANVACLVACKIEAFRDRGAADPIASTDLEDLVALLDGCAELEAATAKADPDVRAFVATWSASLRADVDLLRVAEGQLPRGGDMAGRRRRLRERLARLAAMGM